MTKVKFYIYVVVMSIIPFLVYDLLYIYLEWFNSFGLFVLLDKISFWLDNVIMFILIYILGHYVFYKLLIANIYNRDIVSWFDE